jgi:hypothetical protein
MPYAKEHPMVVGLVVAGLGLAFLAFLFISFVVSVIVVVSRKERPGWQKGVAWAYIACSLLGGFAFVALGVWAIAHHQNDDIGKPAIAYVTLDLSQSGWSEFQSAVAEGYVRGFVSATLQRCGYRIVEQNLSDRLFAKTTHATCDLDCVRRTATDAHAVYFMTGALLPEGEERVARLRVYRTESGEPLGSFELRGTDAADMLQHLGSARTSCKKLLNPPKPREVTAGTSEPPAP